jgi:hypothetical protein
MWPISTQLGYLVGREYVGEMLLKQFTRLENSADVVRGV